LWPVELGREDAAAFKISFARRSSSIASTRVGDQPSATARSDSPYCNRVDS